MAFEDEIRRMKDACRTQLRHKPNRVSVPVFNKTEPNIKYEDITPSLKSKKSYKYLKKGEGKLASSYQEEDSNFVIKRKQDVIQGQKRLENNPYYLDDPIKYRMRHMF